MADGAGFAVTEVTATSIAGTLTSTLESCSRSMLSRGFAALPPPLPDSPQPGRQVAVLGESAARMAATKTVTPTNTPTWSPSLSQCCRTMLIFPPPSGLLPQASFSDDPDRQSVFSDVSIAPERAVYSVKGKSSNLRTLSGRLQRTACAWQAGQFLPIPARIQTYPSNRWARFRPSRFALRRAWSARSRSCSGV